MNAVTSRSPQNTTTLLMACGKPNNRASQDKCGHRCCAADIIFTYWGSTFISISYENRLKQLYMRATFVFFLPHSFPSLLPPHSAFGFLYSNRAHRYRDLTYMLSNSPIHPPTDTPAEECWDEGGQSFVSPVVNYVLFLFMNLIMCSIIWLRQATNQANSLFLVWTICCWYFFVPRGELFMPGWGKTRWKPTVTDVGSLCE